ncbi:Multi antimicrobial extrusion protein like protein [Aduncisulcus paluster]|uniref:Multi antimicrobial extrusion protein like protein n=1 Tax=Aduncisulcus paluster TaxID=2918883 RepID=A0ABQ5KT88_9EUKA|nr:Multi antimicrobial extrusion protein like protein [Aduncisulcus paluster]
MKDIIDDENERVNDYSRQFARNHPRKRSKSILEEKVSSKPIIPLIASMTIPSIISCLFGALYSSIDSIYIGRFSSDALAAIAIAFPIEQLLIWGCCGLCNLGSSALISKLIGEGKMENAEKVLGNTIFYWIVFAFLIPACIVPFAHPIVRAFGAEGEIEDLAADYLKIIAYGSFAYSLSASGTNLPRAEGNVMLGMSLAICAAVLNIILDPILIFTFDLGLNGAAISTVVSQTLPGIYMVYYFIKKSYVRLHRKNLIPVPKFMIRILLLGIGPFVLLASNAITVYIVNWLVCPLAAASFIADMDSSDVIDPADVINLYIAIFSVATKLKMIPIYISGGFLQGFLPLQGFVLGAQEYNKSYLIKRSSQIVCVLFSLILSMLTMAFAPFLMGQFISRDNPLYSDFVGIGSHVLRINCAFVACYSYLMISSGDFQADNKQGLAAFCQIVKIIILYSLILICTKIDGISMNLVWWLFPISDVSSFIIVGILSEIRDYRVLKMMKNLGQSMNDVEMVSNKCSKSYDSVEVVTIEGSISENQQMFNLRSNFPIQLNNS